MRGERPDLTVFTALSFETRIARRLGLSTAGLAGARVPAFAGTVQGVRLALVEVGVRAARLSSLPDHPLLRPRRGVLSAGLAGGLDPSLRAAAIVTADEVVTESGRYRADSRLTEALGAGGAQRLARLYSSPEVLATPARKEEAATRTGAGAVDMESGAIAAWAVARALPFAVLRGISDPAASSVPAIFLPGARMRRAGLVLAIPDAAALAARALRARRRLGTRLLRSLPALAEHPPSYGL